ncbi:MAG: molecular chaperone HtpG [Verrucomicrobia bacterium]|nr:molecular chaperone HtpG [Verrucomicrobiota bacterium]
MTQKTLKIHTENILPIIKKWLYSEKDIFVRELVSNSCDALRKLQILGKLDDPRIDITIDKNAKTITFADSGIGMTADEVEKYIAQIAFSGAEEFVAKYQAKDSIIGHFGLGFYSAYMVSSSVTLDTLSHEDGAEAALWTCDGSSTYSLEKGSRTTRGTTITLHVSEEEYLEDFHLRSILKKYCAFLPYPIYFNGTRINQEEPLWLKNPSECTDKEYLDFYHTLYPMESDPIFWIHLSVDYPFHLQGILYFPKISRRFEWGKSSIQLFCSRVFVSDNCKDLLPDFLTCLRGALDSPDIPLNVSRSTLQMDRTVRQLATHITKKVADRLSTLYQNEKEKFLAAWSDIEIVIKLGLLQDEKFYERAKDFLVWKTVSGSWILLSDQKKVFYTADPHAPILELFKDKEVIIASTPVDSAVMNFLEHKLSMQFQRVDGALDDNILDSAREKTLLDAEGKTESARIADYFRSVLSCPVEAKSLASDALPAFLMLEEKSRRLREQLALYEKELPVAKQTFVVNTNSPLINKLVALKDKKPVLAEQIAKHLYDLSLMSQKELEGAELPKFAQRSSQLIETLLSAE